MVEFLSAWITTLPWGLDLCRRLGLLAPHTNDGFGVILRRPAAAVRHIHVMDGVPGVLLTTNIVGCPAEEVDVGDRVLARGIYLQRRTGTFGFNSSIKCQLIASPSRSSSVASRISSTSLASFFSSAMRFFLSAETT